MYTAKFKAFVDFHCGKIKFSCMAVPHDGDAFMQQFAEELRVV